MAHSVSMSRNIAVWVILCWLGVLSPVMALSVRVLAWDDAIATRKLALVTGDTVREIKDMHPLKRTPAYHLKVNQPLALRAMDAKPGEDGVVPQRVIVIPESMKVPLLLILPDATDATGVRTLLIDDNPAGFAWGTYRFINATPRDLVVQMEKIAKRVPAGWTPADIQLGGETRGVGARISLAEKIEEPLYSAVWEYSTESRTLCFMVPGTDARNSPIDFKAIPEDKLGYQLQQQEIKKDTSD